VELRLREVRQFQSDFDPRYPGEPAAYRRARHAEIGGDAHVTGALDEIPEPMIVASLRAKRGHHPENDPPIAVTAQLLRRRRKPLGATRTRAQEYEMPMGAARHSFTFLVHERSKRSVCRRTSTNSTNE
jgi:hypothetical protein